MDTQRITATKRGRGRKKEKRIRKEKKGKAQTVVDETDGRRVHDTVVESDADDADDAKVESQKEEGGERRKGERDRARSAKERGFQFGVEKIGRERG